MGYRPQPAADLALVCWALYAGYVRISLYTHPLLLLRRFNFRLLNFMYEEAGCTEVSIGKRESTQNQAGLIRKFVNFR